MQFQVNRTQAKRLLYLLRQDNEEFEDELRYVEGEDRKHIEEAIKQNNKLINQLDWIEYVRKS